MKNLYARLPELKAQLGRSAGSTADDESLNRLTESASRAVDKSCNRHFYSETGIRYFNGTGTRALLLWDGAEFSDVVSLSAVAIDEDGDGTFEKTLTADTDYLLWPWNPRAYEPYTELRINPNSASVGAWPRGPRRVKLTGVFGYSDEREATGATLAAAISSTSATSITFAATGHVIAPGDTIVIDSEKLAVSAVSDGATRTATVERGINGTTAATHTDTTAIYRSRYDRDVEIVTIEQVSRLARELLTGFGGGAGGAELGYSFSGLYPDIAERLARLRRGLGVA